MHGGMAQDVGPILEMVTERYLLRSAHAWQCRQRAIDLLDDILGALCTGDSGAVHPGSPIAGGRGALNRCGPAWVRVDSQRCAVRHRRASVARTPAVAPRTPSQRPIWMTEPSGPSRRPTNFSAASTVQP